MMKTTFLTMAAVAALSAAPAAAQPWLGGHNHSAELQTQIDDGVRDGTISRTEMLPLRDSLRRLIRLERQFAAGGISGRENAVLRQRHAALQKQINLAERSGTGTSERRAAWEARYDREHRADWEARYLSERQAQWDNRFDRDSRSGSNGRFDRPNRGDRFSGDVRVGQRYSSRMTALPAEYRIDYPDSAEFYHGYDDDRIYRIDRRTGLILGMVDVLN